MFTYFERVLLTAVLCSIPILLGVFAYGFYAINKGRDPPYWALFTIGGLYAFTFLILVMRLIWEILHGS